MSHDELTAVMKEQNHALSEATQRINADLNRALEIVAPVVVECAVCKERSEAPHDGGTLWCYGNAKREHFPMAMRRWKP